MVGTPLFSHLELAHAKGKLIIKAPAVSSANRYIKSIRLNGKELKRFYLLHNELFSGNALLEFEMTETPVIK
jgi:putative alpha-1,2-mannosidase